MTDKHSEEYRIVNRRTVLKSAAATGAAATGIATFGGQAAAQQQGNRPRIEDIQNTVETNQAGQGLVVVQVGGVSLNALNANNVQLFFNEELIEISDVEILTAGDDLVQIIIEDSLNDLIDIFGNTVAVTVSILGGAVTETEQNVELVSDSV